MMKPVYYEKWSPKEEQRLWEYVTEQNLSYREISELTGRGVDGIRCKVFSLRKQHGKDWTRRERIGFFDIESSHLKANIGNMISWSMKPRGGDVKYMGWTRREAIDWKRMDRRIVRELCKELNNYDLLVTYFGSRFDIGFIRTRAMILGIPFPGYGTIKHFDLYYAVRNKLSLHSNRLAVATETLDIEGKTPLPPEVWGEARLGYPKAMDLIREHNEEDVIILEELFEEMYPYINITRNGI